jgi:alpha-L-fucosidase 2
MKNMTRRSIVVVALGMILGVGSLRAAEPLRLWYDKPAGNWEQQGMPMGNGRLGCMVLGGVEQERVQFNVDSLWTGAYAGNEKSFGSYQSFGNLWIDLEPGATRKPFSEYRRELSLGEGEFRATFVRDGVTHTRTVFASQPDQLIAVRWTTDRSGGISGTLRLEGTHGEKPWTRGDTLGFGGTLTNGIQYEARTRVVVKGGTVEPAAAGALRLRGCNEVLVLLAARTSYVMDSARKYLGDPPGPRVAKDLDAVVQSDYARLRERHLSHYRNLFGRVAIDLGRSSPERQALPTDQRIKIYGQNDGGDPELEALLFQFGRYVLISSSQRPGLPANLQGLWNQSNKPPWNSDYHTDINVEMNYWAAEPANLPECHLPLFDLIGSQLEPWRKVAQSHFTGRLAKPEFKDRPDKVRGWLVGAAHNITGGTGWLSFGATPNAWLCMHLWEHYAFGGDKEYLRQTAYPIMKEACELWEDQLIALPDGRLIAPVGMSPEHGPGEQGGTYSQELVWDLFGNFIAAAEALGVDREYREKIAALRARLLLPAIGKWGQLQEWMVDRDNADLTHRHTSQMMGLYPGRRISRYKTPELARAAMVALAARGENGEAANTWTWAWRCALWARLGQAEHAHRQIRNMLTHNVYQNLFAGGCLQVDGTLGITGAMSEMLLQSQEEPVELLPAMPAAWADGSVKGLRARGGLTVDMQWKDGKVTGYKLSAAEPCEVRVRINGEVKTVKVEKR